MDYTALTAYASVAGAIGGIIAGIALVISLIYLAYEVRDNTRAVHGTAYHSNVANTMALLMPIITNPDVAEFFLREFNGQSSGSGLDQFRWHCAMLVSFRHYDNLLYQHNLGSLEASQWNGYALTLDQWLQRPGFRAWIEKNGHLFSEELRALVREKIAAMRPKQ